MEDTRRIRSRGGFLYLEPVISKIFPIHLLNGFAHAGNVTVLQERILRDTVHLFNVDVLETSTKHNNPQSAVNPNLRRPVFFKDTWHSKLFN